MANVLLNALKCMAVMLYFKIFSVNVIILLDFYNICPKAYHFGQKIGTSRMSLFGGFHMGLVVLSARLASLNIIECDGLKRRRCRMGEGAGRAKKDVRFISRFS